MAETDGTADVFDNALTHPTLPLVGVPNPWEDQVIREYGAVVDAATRLLITSAFRVSGASALARSRDRFEAALRSTDIRETTDALTISATLALQPPNNQESASARAARLVLGARSLFDDLRNGLLEPDTVKGRPAEMGLYPNLFGTHIATDGHRTRLHRSRSSDSIAVLIRGRVFIVRLWRDGATPSLSQVADLLDRLDSSVKSGSPLAQPSACLLTSACIETQRKVFEHYGRDSLLTRRIAAIRRTLFTLCFDSDASPGTVNEVLLAAHRDNPANRWNLASFQVVVFSNAQAAAVCSFRAWLDGNTMMRGAAEIERRSRALDLTSVDSTGAPSFEEAPLPISQETASRSWQDHASRCDTRNDRWTFELNALGATKLRSEGISPVPTFTSVLARTVARFHDRTPSLGQFLSMSAYRHMGVRVASVTTPELARFVNDWDLTCCDAPMFVKNLRASESSQGTRCRETRRTLTLMEVFRLLRSSQSRWQRRRAEIVEKTLKRTLRMLGRYTPLEPRDVLLSHPEIFAEISAVGRPGVRLPYVRCFAVHYQIFADKIVLTISPGTEWDRPLTELVASLEEDLHMAARCIGQTRGREAGSPLFQLPPIVPRLPG